MPSLFDSRTSIASASHHMAPVTSVLSIVHATWMLYRSLRARCWDFTVLVAEDLEYPLMALDCELRKSNSVVKRVLLQELSILNALWFKSKCLYEKPNGAKEVVRSHIWYLIQVIWSTSHVVEIRLYGFVTRKDIAINSGFTPYETKPSVTCDHSCWGKKYFGLYISCHSTYRRIQ